MLKKALVICGLLIGLILGGVNPALAVGTFGGTDLINIPNSSVLPHGHYSLGMHLSERNHTKFQADLGLVPNLEIGAVVDFWPKDKDATLRLKYRLVPETRDSIGLAIGVQDLGRDKFTSYLVAGDTLPEYGIRWHLGFGTGGLDGIFAGITKVYNSVNIREGKRNSVLPRVILIGEYDGSGLNLGTRIDLSMGIFFDLAVTDMRDFTVGVSYNNYL